MKNTDFLVLVVFKSHYVELRFIDKEKRLIIMEQRRCKMQSCNNKLVYIQVKQEQQERLTAPTEEIIVQVFCNSHVRCSLNILRVSI